MSQFITRVELHTTYQRLPQERDYQLLHSQMEAQGFTRTIRVGMPAEVQHLPPAEYCFIGLHSTADVHKKAVTAATATGFKHSIVAVKADEIVVSGLA
jgi:hypothetical protein